MTAIGAALVCMVWLMTQIGLLDTHSRQVAGGAAALVGFVFLIAGAVTWLWQVMP